MNCDIIKDLLPLVAAEECSDATRDVVEEHIQTCKSCRESLASMQEPAVLMPAAEDENKAAKVESMNFKKGFKKIRRRWLISILCVILAIPFGVLGVNEVRGNGYTYSNLGIVYKTNVFMQKIFEKDYAAASDVIDMNILYRSCITWEKIRDNMYDGYRKIQIGDETFFSNLPADTSREIYSLETTDPAEFWAQMIVDNAEQKDVHNPVPASYIEEAAAIVSEKFGKKVSILPVGSEETDDRYAYIEQVTPEGESFYFQAVCMRDEDYVKWSGANYLPEKEFYEFMDRIFPGLKGIDYHSQTYEKLGIEEYERLFKKQYVQTLESLEKQGIYATSYLIDSLYRGYEDDYLDDSEKLTPFWEIQVAIQSSHSGAEESGCNILIYSKESSISAAYASKLPGRDHTLSEQEQLSDALSGNIYVLQ